MSRTGHVSASAEAGEERGRGGRSGSSAAPAGTGSHARFDIKNVGTVSRLEMQELLGEFRTLYQERLNKLETLTDGREETLELKMQILQSFINDLSEQNDVLIQAMEELEREDNQRVTALEEDMQDLQHKLVSSEEEVLKLQVENATIKTENYNLRTALQHTRLRELSSVMLRVMPTEHLSGSMATLPPTNSSEVLMECEDVKSKMMTQERMIQNLQTQLQEAVCQHQLSKYEVVDKEQKNQKLQDIITELHNEMAMKDMENMNQLQNIHHLESKIKALKQLGSPHSTQRNQNVSFEANNLLKIELERRNGTILHLRKEVLLLQEKRDGLTAELDVQERRIYHLQGELREGEAKLEQKQSCLQQLKEELEATKKLHNKVQKQCAEIKEFLVQVEGENKTLKAHELEHRTEIAKLTATIQDLELCSQNTKSALAAKAEKTSKELVSIKEELEEKLSETQAQLSEKEQTIYKLRVQVQDANLWTEETKLHLEEVDVEVKTMKTEYNLAMNEVAVKTEQLQAINIVNEDLKVTGAQYEETIRDLESKFHKVQIHLNQTREKGIILERTIKQLEDERSQLQEHCHELVQENEQLHVQLEMENLAMQTEISSREEKLSILQNSTENLQHQYNNCYSELLCKEDNLEKMKKELGILSEESIQHALQLSSITLEKQKLDIDLNVLNEKHNASQKEVHNRDQTILKLKSELKTAEENLRDAKEKLTLQESETANLKTKVKMLQDDEQSLREACREYMKKMSQQEKAIQDLQHETGISNQQISRFDDLMHKQELEIAQLKEQMFDSENQVARANQNYKSFEANLDLYKQKYQSCVDKITHLENTKQQLEAELQDANEQLCCHNESHRKLHNEMLTARHQCENKCRQVESCEDAIDHLTEQLQTAQEDLSTLRVHVAQCEEIIHSLRDQATIHHSQAENWEENVVKLQTDFASYKATHSHTDAEYDIQTAHLGQLKKDFAKVIAQNSEHLQEIKKYQEEVYNTNLKLTAVTEQKDKEITRLEKIGQSLQLDKTSVLEKHQMETAKLGQQIMNLENDLRNCENLYTQQKQAIQKRDDLLRKSEADLLQARDCIKGKGREIEKQDSVVKALTKDLQRQDEEIQQKENDNNSIKMERGQLKQDLQKTNKQCREFEQELAHQKEKLLLMGNSLQTIQDQLRDRTSETVRHEQANRTLQSELKALKEQTINNNKEMEDYRTQIEKLQAENVQHKQRHENAVMEGLRQQQSIYKMEIKVNSSGEEIKMLQGRLREKEDRILNLDDSLAHLQKKHQVLLNKYKNCESELQLAQKKLLASQKENKYSSEEVTRHGDAFAKLQSQFDMVQEQAQKTKHELLASSRLIHDLRLELTACQGAQKENVEQLGEKCREIASLKNDIACSQQRNVQLAEESTTYEERIKRLHDELKKSQELNQRAEEEAHIYENRLMELSSQVMLSQRKTHKTMKELTSKEEELMIMKVELTSLQERYHSKTEELETLRMSLHDARSDSSRLHRESELVVANVNQWVKDQKQANEKLGKKIKEQTKQILQLSTEKDHLQEMNERLQQENKKLKVEMDEKRITNERLKALHSYSTEDPRVMHQLRSQLQDEVPGSSEKVYCDHLDVQHPSTYSTMDRRNEQLV
ncbi:polyamine-modulated factor 1-binding protein 1 isoform X3 [Narcine bancroftii]|uniref:polyamine-modulated factor 1-binding protein 1 isoform X3 n=1 Tax=Narcine bancroftii TaxID=1343680 RepID=UPI003831EFF6